MAVHLCWSGTSLFEILDPPLYITVCQHLRLRIQHRVKLSASSIRLNCYAYAPYFTQNERRAMHTLIDILLHHIR